MITSIKPRIHISDGCPIPTGPSFRRLALKMMVPALCLSATALAALPAPNQVTPNLQSYNVSHPELDWNAVTGAESYDVEILQGGAVFHSGSVHAFIDRYVPSTPLLWNPSGTKWFQWRVRAVEDNGTPGAWSALRFFVVEKPVNSASVPAGATWSQLQGVFIGSSSIGSNTHVTFAANTTYDFTGQSGSGFAIDVRNKNNIVIDGQGATINLPWNAKMVQLIKASNVEVRNLTFHYVEPKYSGGPIIAVRDGSNPDPNLKNTIDVQLHDANHRKLNSHEFLNGKDLALKLQGIGTQSGIVRVGSDFKIKEGITSEPQANSVAEITPNTFRLKFNSVQDYEVGDYWIAVTRSGGQPIYMVESANPVFSNVTMGSAGDECIVTRCSDNIVMMNSKVRRHPNQIHGVNAGTFNLHSARVGPWIENSLFESGRDDVFHLNQYGLKVFQKINPNQIEVAKIKRDWGYDIRVGDPITVVQNKTNIKFQTTVTAITSSGSNDIITMADSDSSNWYITASNTKVFSDRSANNQTVFRKNLVRDNGRRGVIAKGFNGLIEDNLFRDTGKAAILLSSDQDEGHQSVNWMIRGNLIIGNSRATTPHAAIGTGLAHVATQTVNENIHIEDNDIFDAGFRPFIIADTKDVFIRDNRIYDDGTFKYMNGSTPQLVHTIGAVSNLVVQNNEFVCHRPYSLGVVSTSTNSVDNKPWQFAKVNPSAGHGGGSVSLHPRKKGTVTLQGAGLLDASGGDKGYNYTVTKNQWAGDMHVVARVKFPDGTGNLNYQDRAGITVRGTPDQSDPNALQASVFFQGNRNVTFWVRDSIGGNLTWVNASPPQGQDEAWLLLERIGNNFTACYHDGVEWVEIGTRSVPFTLNQMHTGLGVSSGSDTKVITAEFDGVGVQRSRLLLEEAFYEQF